MKKTKMIIWMILVSFFLTEKTVSQTTCGSAQSLVGYTNGSNLTQNILNKWYYFTASTTDMFVDIEKSDTTFNRVDSIFVYSNVCASLTQIGSFGRNGPPVADSLYGMEIRIQNVTISNTYYIRVKLRSTPSYTVNYKFNLHDASISLCNLISNGDFENIGTGCPGYYGCYPNNYALPSWVSGGYGDGGIFNLCNNNYTTLHGTPHSGNTMAVILTGDWAGAPSSPSYSIDLHSYLKTTFPNMTNGKKYYVQLFYMLSHKRNFLVTDGLGIFLSSGPPVVNTPTQVCQKPITPQITPQFANPANSVMTNTVWLPLGGVFTATNSENYLIFGNFRPASTTSMQIYNPSGMDPSNYFIDDVSITPLDLVIYSPTICPGMSIQLNPLTCTPPYCTSTYTWIPNTALSSTNTINPYASPSVTTTYTLTQIINNPLNNTIATLTAQVTVSVTVPSFTLNPTASNYVICTNLSQTSATLFANASPSTGLTYTWQPGSVYTSSTAVTPTATTIYTVSGLSSGGCLQSSTIAVNVNSACCTTTLTPYNGPPVLTGNTITTAYAFNYDIIIQTQPVYFRAAEFQFAPGVKISLPNGAGELQIDGAHLYGCTTEMWEGIKVDGGSVLKIGNTPSVSSQGNLIEDAKVAVEVTNPNVVGYTYGSSLTIRNAIFNKNYIAVSINGFTKTATPFPFLIHSNVFTCRSLTFTPTSWPSATTSVGGLRAASSSTDGLTPPFNLQGSLTFLKNPYSSQTSQIGIALNAVGTTTNPSTFKSIQIGNTTSADEFNLFDCMGEGIEAVNSNVLSLNNVFQNSQYYTIYPPYPLAPYTFGGSGIRDIVTSDFNAKLDLTASSSNRSYGNRFYNCHYGLNCDNTYAINCKYATFRSTQTYTATAFGPGDQGFSLRTNRFSYNISNNNVANINFPISISLSPANYSFASSGYGIYADQLLIQQNYIGAQITPTTTINGQYINWAIVLSGPATTTFAYGSNNCSVLTNTLDRVYTGMYIDNIGKSNYAVNTCSNSIYLVDNQVSTNPWEYGILYPANTGGLIRQNTITATTYTNSGDYSMGIGIDGSPSTSVTCNKLSKCFQAFTFSQNNVNSVWAGNTMTVHSRGLVLANNGVFGASTTSALGSSGNPIDNEWNTNYVYGTMVDGSSTAALSKLWVKTGIYTPTNNVTGGIPSTGYNFHINTTTGSYDCSASGPPPGGRIASDSSSSEPDFFAKEKRPELTDEMRYMEDLSKHKFVSDNNGFNDLKKTDQDYFAELQNSSVGKILQIDASICNGNLDVAATLIAAISPTNAVEQRYKDFYAIYIRYYNKQLTVKDESDLLALANLCPGTDGMVVYQARALRNIITKRVYTYDNTCPENELKKREGVMIEKSKLGIRDMDIYPNPNSGSFSVVSKNEKESLSIMIINMSGKLVYSANVLTENFVSLLNLNLDSGVYLVSIKNDQNETVNKKMVITK